MTFLFESCNVGLKRVTQQGSIVWAEVQPKSFYRGNRGFPCLSGRHFLFESPPGAHLPIAGFKTCARTTARDDAFSVSLD